MKRWLPGPGCVARNLHWLLLVMFLFPQAHAQDTKERVFSQPKATIEKALKGLQPTAGRLPTLEGFVAENTRSLERFQRGYYECSVSITAAGSGGSSVRVRAKITAWYQDPAAAASGYQTLPSNGRLEADLLDRLADALGDTAASVTHSTPASSTMPTPAPRAVVTAPNSSAQQPTIAAPVPQLPALSNPLTGSSMPRSTSTNSPDVHAQREAVDQHLAALVTEEKNLEEILHNQSHPTNLVAVKKGGAPVLATPAEGAKLLFTAAPEDEFEVLDMNASWVHVRISGLSRGWIRRANLEMPEDAAPAQAADLASSQPFHVTNEQIVSFPGDWEPLRGKTVKIVSVQAAGDAVVGWRAKRDYAKTIFQKDYETLAASGGESGEVIVFDAQDGGMIAATLTSVKQWRANSISDDDFWKGCYFDPPETFGAQPSQ